ncbi:polysaccharide biosynthesis protein [Thalassobacillus sp. CUG 92003]|uniref:putative polysaccharide biosynthesis protein n=1 Tax=Thalassobacillus sp. CUG 92003 TaxID=2736641 RepID=UPI0015E7B03B|nr:polysaccharide biosynthesis protein [Thalassobacillus sp. CUG 92003]
MSHSTLIKSTFILTLATLVSKLLGSLFRIPLQNIAGDEVLGIFSLVYPVYMVTLILSVAGIPIAISKLISEARVARDTTRIRHIYITASWLGLLFGVLSFSLISLFSKPISSLLGGEETLPALLIVATSLLVAPYMAVYRGYFQGFEDMRPTALSQVIEQFVRAGLIIVLAYVLTSYQFSNDMVAGGVMVGSVAGVLASLVYLRIKYIRSPHHIQATERYSLQHFKTWSRLILRISIPIAVGTITMALLNLVDSLTIPLSLSQLGADPTVSTAYQYGIYGRGLSLVQIATVFATSIILPLVPLLTAKKQEHDRTEMVAIIEQTQRLTHLISWPAAAGLFALAIPLNVALFTNAEGSLVIAILGASSVFTSLTIVSTGVLQGIDFAKQAAWIILGGVVIKAGLNLWLVVEMGIAGAGLATLLVYMLLAAGNGVYLLRQIRFRIIESAHLKTIASSLIMGAVVGLPTLYFSMAHWSRGASFLYVAGAMIVGAILYSGSLYIMKAIDRQTLQQLPIFGKYIR